MSGRNDTNQPGAEQVGLGPTQSAKKTILMRGSFFSRLLLPLFGSALDP
jgi:hypothetical protein